MTLPEPLPCQRSLFDIPEEVAYLNCAYMSPLLRASAEQGYAGIASKLRPWTIRVEDFFTPSEQFRTLAARLLGATAEDIAIIPSASYGIETAARNLPVSPGQRILVLAEQFPSHVYPWRRLAARTGASVQTISWPSNGDWTSAVLAALTPGAAIAALPHVHWTSGGLLDLEQIAAACRANSTALAVDLTQSLGVVPFDAARIQPDFAVAASYKWLLGPYSIGLLYAAPQHHSGDPLEEGWITRSNSRDFSRLIDYVDGYAPGARRYDMGERSNFALLGAACQGIQQLLDWGVDRIAATCAHLTLPLVREGAALGFTTWPDPHRAPHYVCLRRADPWPASLIAGLAASNIHISLRGPGMRVTPHVYNRPDEVERLAGLLRRHA